MFELTNPSFNCIFCKIIKRQLPCFRVYENDETLAFMDINPAATGHVLVIPKQHRENLYAMTDDELASTMTTVRIVANSVNRKLSPDGISLIQANGKGAAQSVPHFHIHIMPRKLGDELKINWKLVSGDVHEIKAVAELIEADISLFHN